MIYTCSGLLHHDIRTGLCEDITIDTGIGPKVRGVEEDFFFALLGRCSAELIGLFASTSCRMKEGSREPGFVMLAPGGRDTGMRAEILSRVSSSISLFSFSKHSHGR